MRDYAHMCCHGYNCFHESVAVTRGCGEHNSLANRTVPLAIHCNGCILHHTGIDNAPLKSRDWNKMASPDSEAVARVREDEHAGTPGEEAHLTEGENEVVLSKLAEGIFGLLGPAVNEIDDRVADVR